MNAKIKVTIHEKKKVSSIIRATLLPLLFANLAFIIKGKITTKKINRRIINSGKPIPNIAFPFHLYNKYDLH